MNEEQLRENLKKLRMKLNPVSPFQVFNDEELEQLVKSKPKSLSSLKTIKGFPANGARITKYGKEIISIFLGANNISSLSKF